MENIWLENWIVTGYWDIFFEIGEVKGGSESILGEV